MLVRGAAVLAEAVKCGCGHMGYGGGLLAVFGSWAWLPREYVFIRGWLLAAYKECGFFDGWTSSGVGAVVVGRLLRHKHFGFHTAGRRCLLRIILCHCRPCRPDFKWYYFSGALSTVDISLRKVRVCRPRCQGLGKSAYKNLPFSTVYKKSIVWAAPCLLTAPRCCACLVHSLLAA